LTPPKFEKERLVPDVFGKYALGGGTLIVSAEKLADGTIDPVCAGITFGKAKMACGKKLVEALTKREVADLTERYSVFKPEGQPTAYPYYVDENGAVLAWVKEIGKGRIVTVACERMLPNEVAKAPSHQYVELLNKYLAGELRFDLIETLLGRLSVETMPFKVDGDVMWGMNKVEKCEEGEWLVWLYNNNGVKHFIGEEETYDVSKTAKVTIRRGLEGMAVEVPPGEVRFVYPETGKVVNPHH